MKIIKEGTSGIIGRVIRCGREACNCLFQLEHRDSVRFLVTIGGEFSVYEYHCPSCLVLLQITDDNDKTKKHPLIGLPQN